MSTLKVTVVADGLTRRFDGTGDGPELVAAFRVWLSSPDLYLPMAVGSDEIDRTAARLEQGQDAPVLDPSAGDVIAPAAPPTPVAAAAPAAPTLNPESERLRGEIMRVLASGASYDAREIARNVRGAYPDVSAAALVPVLEHLARERYVVRITGVGHARFQKPGPARARARA